MNNKEKLLEYINNNMTDTVYLLTKEFILYSPGDAVVSTNQKGSKTWLMTKEKLTNIIVNNFNNGLQEVVVRPSGIRTQIVDWSIAV